MTGTSKPPMHCRRQWHALKKKIKPLPFSIPWIYVHWLVGTNETAHDVECTTCSCRTDRSKLDSIAVAPRVLQLQIKRLTTDSSGLHQSKSNTPVDFPLLLQIRESQLDGKTRPPAAYDQHAVSLHLGYPGTPTAHFITLVHRGSLWYVVNDAEH